MQALEQALAEVAARVPGFKPPTGDALTAQLKRVAEYVTPGKYILAKAASVVRDAVKLKERAAAAALEAGNVLDMGNSSRSTSPEPVGPSPHAQQQQQHQPKQAAQQGKKKQPQQQNGKQKQGGAAKAVAGSQRPTTEPQQRNHIQKQVQHSNPEAMLQLVADDLDIPTTVRSSAARKLPVQPSQSKDGPAASPLQNKPKPAEAPALHQVTKKAAGLGQAKPAKKGFAGQGNDAKVAAAAGGIGARQPAKPKKRKSPLGDAARQGNAEEQQPPGKPQKRARQACASSSAAIQLFLCLPNKIMHCSTLHQNKSILCRSCIGQHAGEDQS